MNWMAVLIIYTFGTNLLAAANIEDCRRIAKRLPMYDDDDYGGVYLLPKVSTKSRIMYIYRVFQIGIFNFEKIIGYQMYAKNNVSKCNR